jgi:hypothetical protein
MGEKAGYLDGTQACEMQPRALQLTIKRWFETWSCRSSYGWPEAS